MGPFFIIIIQMFLNFNPVATLQDHIVNFVIKHESLLKL